MRLERAIQIFAPVFYGDDFALLDDIGELETLAYQCSVDSEFERGMLEAFAPVLQNADHVQTLINMTHEERARAIEYHEREAVRCVLRGYHHLPAVWLK